MILYGLAMLVGLASVFALTRRTWDKTELPRSEGTFLLPPLWSRRRGRR